MSLSARLIGRLPAKKALLPLIKRSKKFKRCLRASSTQPKPRVSVFLFKIQRLSIIDCFIYLNLNLTALPDIFLDKAPVANLGRSAKLAIVILPCCVVFLILLLMVVKFIRKLQRRKLGVKLAQTIDSEEHFKQVADEENQEIQAN